MHPIGPSTCCFQPYDWPSLAQRVNQSDVAIIDKETGAEKRTSAVLCLEGGEKMLKDKNQDMKLPIFAVVLEQISKIISPVMIM